MTAANRDHRLAEHMQALDGAMRVLQREQRALERKAIGSGNRERQRAVVARQRRYIANRRDTMLKQEAAFLGARGKEFTIEEWEQMIAIAVECLGFAHKVIKARKFQLNLIDAFFMNREPQPE